MKSQIEMQKEIDRLNKKIEQLEMLAKVNRIRTNGLQKAFIAGFESVEYANMTGVPMEDCWDQYVDQVLSKDVVVNAEVKL